MTILLFIAALALSIGCLGIVMTQVGLLTAFGVPCERPWIGLLPTPRQVSPPGALLATAPWTPCWSAAVRARHTGHSLSW